MVYYVLKRNGLNRLPRNVRKHRVQLWHRYEKQVPGHHVQVDVKFLTFAGPAGKTVKRYLYTAIYDATRIEALKVYERHTQENAIDFSNYVVEKFPFHISTIRTDNGHEFQSLFHWHVVRLRGEPHIHPCADATAQREGEAVAPHGQGGVLPAADLHGRCRSEREAGGIAELL